jgi:antitoxin YefM
MQAAVLNALGFSEARARFSELFDQVVNEYAPTIVTRRRHDVVILRRDLLQGSVLSGYDLDVQCEPEPDGSITLSIETLGLVVNGTTREDARRELIEDLRHYAADYLGNLPLFLNAPNRKHHLPYILRIALAQDDSEIEQMLGT